LQSNSRLVIPAHMHPGARTAIAIQNGVEKNLLFRTWGGIGDQICAEPTLRYAMKKFPSCKISLASEAPQLFEHLKFEKVYRLAPGCERPDYNKYLLFDTITPPDESNMVWLFFSHLLTHCVDFPSMCALRLQLPTADKEVYLPSTEPKNWIDIQRKVTNGVIVHPGRHWQSKTFPKSFWDRVLAGLRNRGITPVLIGANTDDNRGTVDVETDGCLDLRNKLSITESIWCLQRAAVLLTNDSSPLHMAVSGRAYIGFIATCKHPDMIMHWRRGEWGWRQKNFGKGGIWDHVDYCPNQDQKVVVEEVDPKLLESWLPSPYEMSNWAKESRDKILYEAGLP
jgi:ADP-heptose:LPS heptosyltransferase